MAVVSLFESREQLEKQSEFELESGDIKHSFSPKSNRYYAGFMFLCLYVNRIAVVIHIMEEAERMWNVNCSIIVIIKCELALVQSIPKVEGSACGLNLLCSFFGGIHFAFFASA